MTNVGHDRNQLAHRAQQAKVTVGTDTLEVVADRGYFRGEELRACDQAQVTTYLPKPQTSGNMAHGQFGKRDFIHRPEDDEYECPAGQRLLYRVTQVTIHRYRSSACPRCEMKPAYHSEGLVPTGSS